MQKNTISRQMNALSPCFAIAHSMASATISDRTKQRKQIIENILNFYSGYCKFRKDKIHSAFTKTHER